MVTISTHNGSTVHQAHNVRAEKTVSKEGHIDPTGIHETWVHESERQAYHRLFDDSVKAYNETQTRADRQIKNYYNTVKDDVKKHTSYEMIIGVYPEKGTFIDENTQREILKTFVDGWKERNPNLELIGAYYHADEQGEPHCHIDYIPVAHGYSRGMETQTGLVRALGEMGFERAGKVNAQIQWEHRENEYLEKLCKERGLEVSHPKQEGREHLHTETYKAQKTLENALDHTKDLLDEEAKINARIGNKTEKLTKLDGEIKQAKKLKREKSDKGLFGRTKDTITIPYDEYRSLQKTAKAIEDVKQQEYVLNTLERQLNEDREHIQPRLDEIARMEQETKEKLEYATKLKENQERYIKGTAKGMMEREIGNILGNANPSREQRMEEFMDRVKFEDGTTALDKFVEKEEVLTRRLDRGIDLFDD